jgi:hypothetical protein
MHTEARRRICFRFGRKPIVAASEKVDAEIDGGNSA